MATGQQESGTFSGETVLWNLGGIDDLREHAVDYACRRAGRGLDPEEWARYIVSGLSYEDTCSG